MSSAQCRHLLSVSLRLPIAGPIAPLIRPTPSETALIGVTARSQALLGHTVAAVYNDKLPRNV